MRRLEIYKISFKNPKNVSIILVKSTEFTIFAFKFKILLLHERFKLTESSSRREEENEQVARRTVGKEFFKKIVFVCYFISTIYVLNGRKVKT